MGQVISPAEYLCEQLASLPNGAALLAAAFDELSPLDAAALAFEWEEWWARDNQLPPDGAWRSWGALTGRGWGKSRAIAEYVNREAASGRAMRIALIAQNEDKCLEVLVNGESGLIATSHPWFKASFECGRVVWPNGAQAFVYTPEVPGDIFGPEHHLIWASEIHAWPRSTMGMAFSNLKMGQRLGYARMVWDSNPRKRHPLLRSLLDRGLRAPSKHIVIRGSSYENQRNMADGVVREWEDEYGGTQEGRMMIFGEQNDNDDDALFKQEWIDDNRRGMPERFKRRILSVDPAISMREGTDATGIVEVGQALDDQIVVIDDLSERISVEVWSRTVVKVYFAHRCDCCLVERNRGGDLPVAMIRAVCAELGYSVIELPLEARCPGHTPGVVHVKQVISRQSKEVRAEGVAPLYERGKVSHVIGAALNELEEEMTTWVPGPKVESPNRLDAMVHGVWELAGLWSKKTGNAHAVQDALQMQAALMDRIEGGRSGPASPIMERVRAMGRRGRL